MAITRVLAACIKRVLPAGKLERSAEQCWPGPYGSATSAGAWGWMIFLVDWLDSIAFHIGKTKLSAWMLLNGLFLADRHYPGVDRSRIIRKRVLGFNHLDMNLRIVLVNLSRTLLVVLGVLIALPVVGIDLTVLSVFGGALGVGLGFGLQKSPAIMCPVLSSCWSTRSASATASASTTGRVISADHRPPAPCSSVGADGSEALVPNDTLIANTGESIVFGQGHLAVDSGAGGGTDLDRPCACCARQVDAVSRVQKSQRRRRLWRRLPRMALIWSWAWCGDPENGLLGLRSA